ncbi:uncharacterized protein GGS22DRAFT_194816 [Annulohypoxylon maeteangense]|uniref:uncharacterized protein n=1 Tax=Annulohypoxylon maeteangense TaxID=1927788 RepID=UPI002008416D|nr:uncharacterized protein GGS22DRAFT_194816 [Annulohypoxylon maeteangense]KAI0884253.1 hypothetical protein GGS22DRAFT_194816 [Annulohypoxylon maeteangense]
MRRYNNPKRQKQPELPAGYVKIQDILDESIPVGRLINVIGLVKDRRSPRQTGGSDWKSAITIYDKSIENEPERGLPINIFRPRAEIPEPDATDVVVVISAKVQAYRGEVSLISHRSTLIHVYSANQIPKPPKSAKQALEAPLRPKDRPPGDPEHEYVAWLYHSVSKDAIPDTAEFSSQVAHSANFKDKFQTLNDIHDGQFYDVIVNVVREPYDQMGMTTLWVSDYTENEAFYKFTWNAEGTSESRDGDPYGYTTSNIVPKNWGGPYGKRSMQVTCFGIDADFILKEVKAGDWVSLRNLHAKYGRNLNNLEGFLREDRTPFYSGLKVDILQTDDPENIDGRLKEAIRRKRDYEKLKKQQQKNFAVNEDLAKIKAGDLVEGLLSSKKRRAVERAQKIKEIDDKEREREARLGLNERIKCENIEQPVFAVPSIVEPIPYKTTIDGQEVILNLPFTCAKYRTNVRVVDFRPSRLADFAIWRKNLEYDMLSDHSGDSNSESDEDGTLNKYTGRKIWEWKFALLLEDADPKHKGENNRFWAVVDNTEAQLLLNLDATDLRADPDELDKLREQLFQLWGNLEECKQQELQRQATEKKRVATHQPPPTSPLRPLSSHQVETTTDAETTLSNKPFSCCIRQYGITVREEDPRKADAGDGKRWQRMFALFGTKISP